MTRTDSGNTDASVAGPHGSGPIRIPLTRAPAWERRYARKLLVSDFLIVFASVFTAQFLRFGTSMAELQVPFTRYTEFAMGYSVLSVVLSLGWLFMLAVGDTRDEKIFGIGPTEYKRVVSSTLMAFGAFAIISYLGRAEIGRGYLLIALPIGLVAILLSRYGWRKRLHRQRRRGKNMYRTLVVGERQKIAHVVKELQRDTYIGFDIAGVVTERGTQRDVLPGVSVLGSYDEIMSVVDNQNIDAFIMVSSDHIAPDRMRQIGWELDRRKVDLIVAASLTDIAGPRIHARPVAGMPLIHVDHPRFVGRRRLIKRLFDILMSLVGLILLSPLFLVLAFVVKFDSSGPVIFRQERVGHGASTFKMLKFRSMVADAEDRLPGLLDSSDGNGVLFKMKDDPRITRVGRFMRKYSLDELPQLVNVLKGDMSLVGPRPPLPSEVEGYDRWTRRRLMVKPGVTGLWQVEYSLR